MIEWAPQKPKDEIEERAVLELRKLLDEIFESKGVKNHIRYAYGLPLIE